MTNEKDKTNKDKTKSNHLPHKVSLYCFCVLLGQLKIQVFCPSLEQIS